MSALGEALRPWMPPALLALKRRLRPAPAPRFGWSGDYPDWSSAKSACSGYDDARIVERVRETLLKVRRGEVAAERDSVALDRIPYRWPVLAALLRMACENRSRLGVLDFGGSLGSSYYQCRPYLGGVEELTWSVVEQACFVEVGRRDFADELNFYTSAQACVAERRVDVILASGVLQYLERPYAVIEELLALGVRHVLIDRTAFVDGAQRDRLTVQRSDLGGLETGYPAWFFHEPAFLAAFSRQGYRLEAEFEGMDRWGPPETYYKGFLFVKGPP